MSNEKTQPPEEIRPDEETRPDGTQDNAPQENEREADVASSAASVGVPETEPVARRIDADADTDAQRTRRRGLRRALALVAFAGVFVLVWEGAKWLAGDPWRLEGLGYTHDPPFRIQQLNDLNLPHLWEIVAAYAEPFQRNANYSLANYLFDQAIYTSTEALIGFVCGALIGVGLASLFVHFGFLERAFVPFVVASQTVPIVALAPLIVVGLGPGLTSVVLIATYLTFFPVTIAVMRGLRSPDPRAVELMRSYAASRWDVYRKVRLPASVPYLFTSLKIAAAASLVGTIIGEGPGGVPQGLGRAILNFNQQYITGPERLWATILVASVVGIVFFSLVRIAETYFVTRRGQATA